MDATATISHLIEVDVLFHIANIHIIALFVSMCCRAYVLLYFPVYIAEVSDLLTSFLHI